jgi:uncharacterized protein (TIGR02246 family)
MNNQHEFTVADRVDIHELCAMYNRTVDTADAEGWANCFTEDGEFVSLLVGSHKGRDALAAFAREYWEGEECARWRNGQHWVGNIIVTPDGPNRATVSSYHIMLVPDQQAGVRIDLFAGQQDIVVRTPDGWKLQQRRMVPWPPQGAR